MKPKLSDDWRAEEPLAYLVKNFDTTMCEYTVFANYDDARRHSEFQADDARDAGEPDDWSIYPLYAGEPLENDP